MKNFILYGLVAAAPLLAGCMGLETRNIRIADKILKSQSDPDPAKISSAAAGFRKNDFSAENLGKYSDTGISRVYDALFNVTFFFPEQEIYISFQENVLGEKILRHKQTNPEIERMHKTYINTRMFEKASALRKQFPDAKFQYVPATVLDSTSGETVWRVYDVSPGAEKVILKALPIGVGPKVILGIFPGCPAAEKAMDTIMADPEISTVFKKYGVLLTKRFETKGVLRWREHFNFPEIYIAYKASDFPDFDFTSSPNFYFLRDGKFKFSFSGWSNENEPDYGQTIIRKGLEAISVFPDRHPPQ